MQTRTQSVLVQVCLALICAVGAGLSGDMQVHATGHLSHHARHTRGHNLRGARHNGRDTQGDHALEVEIGHESNDQAQGDSPNAVAILPTASIFTVSWTDLGIAPVEQAGFVQTAAVLHLPARAPPSVA